MALGKRRVNEDSNIEVDMVPIMNMFLVLIPFLLLSASFLHLRIINTSVPVLSSGSDDDKEREEIIKLTAVVQLKKEGIHLSATADREISDINSFKAEIDKLNSGDYPLQQMVLLLKKIKDAYPASDTLILIPDEEILYESIIEVMDNARYYPEKTPLFLNVVLSGKL